MNRIASWIAGKIVASDEFASAVERVVGLYDATESHMRDDEMPPYPLDMDGQDGELNDLY